MYSSLVGQITCGQASNAATTFPVFVGEFSLESFYANTLAGRQNSYQSQLWAYTKYLSGGAFWSYSSVVGELLVLYTVTTLSLTPFLAVRHLYTYRWRRDQEGLLELQATRQRWSCPSRRSHQLLLLLESLIAK